MGAAVLLGALVAPAAHAGVVRSTLQPELLIGATTRPDCASPTAPFAPTDLQLSSQRDDVDPDGFAEFDPALASEALAATTDADLQPLASLCSPTFAGFPAGFGGTIALNPKRARVGFGWRELGGSLAEPAQFLPGDVLTVPEVDDAARLRVSVTTGQGKPTAVAEFTDLSPGPSQVTLAAEPRGLVARLTRADGTIAESIQTPPVVPAFTPTVSGRPSRWSLKVPTLPGSIVSLGISSGSGRDSALVRADAAGVARAVLRRNPTKRRRSSIPITVVTSNRAAQLLDLQFCRVRLTARQAPRSVTCQRETLANLVYGYADEYLLGGKLRGAKAKQALAELQKHLPTAPRYDAATARPARLASAARALAPATQPATRSQAASAPLVAAITPQSASVKRLRASGIRPLAADVNGDGGVDYWSDNWSYSASSALRGSSAGVVLVSGPSGLSEHRVDLPTGGPDWDEDFNSDISAIGDVTGDGIGELVVDLQERHAIIPGSATWTSSTFPIIAPDLTELDAEDRILALDLSSPGSPLTTLDDVNGDGKRELFAADDGRTWMRLRADAISPGAVTRAPSAARGIAPPRVISNLVAVDQGVPRVDPATRFINGQAISLRWPSVATASDRSGSVTITVQDANGRELRPAITVTTPGDAMLLDYDRVTGEALLLAASQGCDVSPYVIVGEECRFSLVRVDAAGKILQTLAGNPDRSSLTLGTARFLTDGPDADARPEVVIAEGTDSAALLTSTPAGAVKATSLPVVQLRKLHRRARAYSPLRFFPVFGADGARRVVTVLPTVAVERYGRDVYRYTRYATLPAELRWR